MGKHRRGVPRDGEAKRAAVAADKEADQLLAQAYRRGVEIAKQAARIATVELESLHASYT